MTTVGLRDKCIKCGFLRLCREIWLWLLYISLLVYLKFAKRKISFLKYFERYCASVVLIIFLSAFSIWPGSLLYMTTVLPVIWVAELAILDEKIASGEENCTQNARESDFNVGRGLVS